MGWNNFPENWEKDCKPQTEILEIDRIPQQLIVGNKYHCNWASSKGMVWVLVNTYNNTAVLQTPRTKKTITTNINSLRVINKEALQNAKKRVKQINN